MLFTFVVNESITSVLIHAVFCFDKQLAKVKLNESGNVYFGRLYGTTLLELI